MTWQPIETAPLDGTWVLVFGRTGDEYNPGEPRQAVAQYVNEGKPHWKFAWYDGGYYGWMYDVTHWQPLAENPKVTTAPQTAAVTICGSHIQFDGWCVAEMRNRTLPATVRQQFIDWILKADSAEAGARLEALQNELNFANERISKLEAEVDALNAFLSRIGGTIDEFRNSSEDSAYTLAL